MRTIAFYSYKGGAGRTLAAVNLAIYAARVGVPAALLDFDLDAPGVDAKLGRHLKGTAGPGILDHILGYQETGQLVHAIKDLARPVELPGGSAALWVVPAGHVEDPSYADRLKRLSWHALFAEDREGVAFFQDLLVRVASELQIELIIVDSRAGQSEIAGLCTHQLGDTVVLLTTPTREGERMTRKVLHDIEHSEVAGLLGKARERVLVSSRLPRDGGDGLGDMLWEYRQDAVTIHSSPTLEKGEYLALLDLERDEKLTAEYLALFRKLDVQPDEQSITRQIHLVASELLSVPVDQSERRLRDLVTLAPRMEPYQALLRFYHLTGKGDMARERGLKLLDETQGEERRRIAEVVAELYTDLLQQHAGAWRSRDEERPKEPRLSENQAAALAEAYAERAEAFAAAAKRVPERKAWENIVILHWLTGRTNTIIEPGSPDRLAARAYLCLGEPKRAVRIISAMITSYAADDVIHGLTLLRELSQMKQGAELAEQALQDLLERPHRLVAHPRALLALLPVIIASVEAETYRAGLRHSLPKARWWPPSHLDPALRQQIEEALKAAGLGDLLEMPEKG